MKIAYLTYWSINEGLSQATSLPHLKVLDGFKDVRQIDYYTFEKVEIEPIRILRSKIRHFALHRREGSSLTNKIRDYYSAWKFINANHKLSGYDIIIARSSFAGIFALMFRLIYGVPFAVESFEPHSDYQACVPDGWSKWGIRYFILSFFEGLQKKLAFVLLPVSNSYRIKLIEEGISQDKIIVQPCCVDYSKVEYSGTRRKEMRNILKIPDENIVGIYVGKFGGLYYEKEAFQRIQDFNNLLRNKFSLIVLTPNDRDYLIKIFLSRGFTRDNIHILFVQPSDVNSYLMAADFAFNFHISNSVSKYFSPIKNAEYWAIGLPIVIPENIGDDSEIIEKYKIGLVHDFKEEFTGDIVRSLLDIISQDNHRDDIRKFTYEYRSMDLILNSYSEMFSRFQIK